MNIELTTTGRDGALTKFRIHNAAALWDDFPGTGYTCGVDGDDIVGRGSKSDLRRLKSWIARQNVQESAKAAKAANSQLRRVLVPFGSVSVGDEIAGRTVRGLGRDFYPNPDQFSQWGISPDYAGTVQYAYFEEN